MDATNRFSPEDVQRILGVSAKQLEYWDRLGLVSLQKEQGTHFYDFRDLIGLPTVCSAHLRRCAKNWTRRRRPWPSCGCSPTERMSSWNAVAPASSPFPASLS